ncbi:MAG: PBP1A family penicillin-binding protein [Kofleriaceae bacterium]|nr:PBP1A family penicillin-binding protein [Kofleriaceae bacterium]
MFFAAKWLAISGLLLFALGTATLAGLFWHYGSDPDLPSIDSLRNYEPDQVKRVVTPEGKLIGELFDQRRSVVGFSELPKALVDAFVSAEDKGFWTHEGIDYIGMLRAALINIRSGKKKQGASTITQQVVKNLLLTRARTFKRKFQEIILARRLEKELSKEEILMLYANVIFFGHGRYGVQEAARYYFGKEVSDINIGEAALLAGLPKGPNLYSPRKPKNYQRSKDRQTYVLQEMANNGYITPEEAQKWVDLPIKVVADSAPEVGLAPEFVEVAKAELEKVVDEGDFSATGLTVVTSVDLKIQALARKALRDNLREYDKRKGYGRPFKTIKKNKVALELVRMAKKVPKSGLKSGKVYHALVLEVFDADNELVVNLGGYKASVVLGGVADKRFNYGNQQPSERFKRGSVIRVMKGVDGSSSPKHSEKEVVFASGPEGAVVVIDPSTRRVLAMIGGYDAKLAGYNRATMAERQAGSTFKPFVYAAAIDSGDFSAASIINDAPEVYDLWKPDNYKRGVFTGPVRLRHALNKSINTVAIRVAHDIGPARVAQLAQALGIKSDLPDGLSLALGSGEVTPLELTNAFASIAAGGKYAPPWIVQAIGENKIESPEGKSVLRPEVAHIVRDMMRTVMTQGTGAKASKLKLQLAGKTGTSNSARDAWFVGMSPELVVGVWVGFDDFRRPLGSREGGSRTALPVFITIMKELGKRSSRFKAPPGVIEVKIDKKTGLLAPEGATDTAYNEVFLEGTVPTEFAPMIGDVAADDAILDQYGDFDDPSTGAE